MPKLITNNNEVLMKSKRFHLMSQTDLNKIGVLDSIKQDEYAIRKSSISDLKICPLKPSDTGKNFENYKSI